MAFPTNALRWIGVATIVAVAAAACAEGTTTRDAPEDEGGVTSGPGSTGTTTAGVGGSGGGAPTTTTSSSSAGGQGGYPCSEDPCKLTSPQCGCAPGQKCTLSGASRVCAADGTKAAGEICTGNQCTAGNLCVTYGSATNATSSCKKFCASDADCQAPGGRCLLDLTDGSNNVIATVCSENCDPVTTVGCEPGLACDAFLDAALVGVTVCRNAGPGTQGSTCVGANGDDCGAGFGCVNIDSQSICARYCKVASPSCPGAGEQCISFSDPLIVGSTEYGVCYAP